MNKPKQITTKEVSLAEFVAELGLRLSEAKVPMPFQNEEKWHRLFYGFKLARNQRGRPDFIDDLQFDWDGPYPKCQDLSECLEALHLNGFITVGNPSYDKFSIDEKVLDRITDVRATVTDNAFEDFFRFSVDAASQLFGC